MSLRVDASKIVWSCHVALDSQEQIDQAGRKERKKSNDEPGPTAVAGLLLILLGIALSRGVHRRLA